jgi:hypothetical protein
VVGIVKYFVIICDDIGSCRVTLYLAYRNEWVGSIEVVVEVVVVVVDDDNGEDSLMTINKVINECNFFINMESQNSSYSSTIISKQT